MGILATSTKTGAAAAHADDAISLALMAVDELDDPDVRIAAYTLFGSFARLLEESFAPLLPRVMPALFQSCEASGRRGGGVWGLLFHPNPHAAFSPPSGAGREQPGVCGGGASRGGRGG